MVQVLVGSNERIFIHTQYRSRDFTESSPVFIVLVFIAFSTNSFSLVLTTPRDKQNRTGMRTYTVSV